MACLITSMLQSCAHVDLKQMTYKALRQHDCRINEPNQFCDRSFSLEYLEYERLREEFLLDTSDQNHPLTLVENNLDSRDSTK